MSDRAFLVFMAVFLVLSCTISVMVWRFQRDAFETAGFIATVLGENARFGFNAWAGFSPVPFTVIALLWSLDVLLPSGYARDVALQVGVLLMVLAFLLQTSLLLFMRPRLLAPPHLRRQRGWIPQAVSSRVDRHRRRSRGA